MRVSSFPTLHGEKIVVRLFPASDQYQYISDLGFPANVEQSLTRLLSETSGALVIAGPAFAISEISRGAAFGDINNDGAIDVVIANNNGPARLLLNQTHSINHNHWLLVRLDEGSGNRFGMGAKVEVRRRGQKLTRRAHTDSSYLSANDVRVHFGLGEDAQIECLTVYWPNGSAEAWDKIQADQIVTIRHGTGRRILGGG